ncbi:helix-turn-helix domain-containing protein [Tenacibaculum amylolyticum]|uniref:helix-turn-helix domain-containing protein n=1 Tax=Tenacibaculum amylolyticum TaxID=104269 RepID=UPI0038936804
MEQITLEFSYLLIIDVLSIATSLILGLLFITLKSDNRKANVFIGLFLWSLSFEVLEAFLEAIEEAPEMLFNATLLTIPLLFLYVNSTLNRKLPKKIFLLFLPWLIVTILGIHTEDLRLVEYLFNVTILIFIFKKVDSNKEEVKDFYSDIENRTLSWIKTIVYIFLFFNAFWILEDIVGFQYEYIAEYFAYVSSILTFFMIYWIGHNGFSQSAMFTTTLFQKQETEIKPEQEDTSEKFAEIIATIESKKYFTISNLNLKLLSDLLEIKEKELSKLINLHTQNNFYQFINQFRVSEFKNLLLSPKAKQLSILGMAQEAGFTSKSTFYVAFKNIEGITPKQYQNSLKESE